MLGEIKHTARHLKKWMAPRRIATALQFMPAKNRLIPQPLGVVGIIAPWNYPLQLTLAPAIGAIAAGNRVMIKPSELVPRFSALLKEVISAKFDATEIVVTRGRGRRGTLRKLIELLTDVDVYVLPTPRDTSNYRVSSGAGEPPAAPSASAAEHPSVQ